MRLDRHGGECLKFRRLRITKSALADQTEIYQQLLSTFFFFLRSARGGQTETAKFARPYAPCTSLQESSYWVEVRCCPVVVRIVQPATNESLISRTVSRMPETKMRKELSWVFLV